MTVMKVQSLKKFKKTLKVILVVKYFLFFLPGSALLDVGSAAGGVYSPLPGSCKL